MKNTSSNTDTIKASSIGNAINLMDNYLSKDLNFSHCKLIIFSEEIAIEGISDQIYTLLNDTQIRPSSNIIISKCTAKYFIEKTSPELENLISKYYEILANSSKYTGLIPDSTIGDFFNKLVCNTCEPSAILGGPTTSIDEQPELAAQNDVLSFPTVVVYVEGQVSIRESGYFSLDEIFAKLERLIELMS